jgi:sulfate transport system substrate-binding protein
MASFSRYISWLGFVVALSAPMVHAETTLLNAACDVPREFYKEYNSAFIAHWKETNGATIAINQTRGGSSRQGRSLVEGLLAEVVTINGVTDMNHLAKLGLIPADWECRRPNNSVPDFGSWAKAPQIPFSDGGAFEQIYQKE